jgi:hypothetical protein
MFCALCRSNLAMSIDVGKCQMPRQLDQIRLQIRLQKRRQHLREPYLPRRQPVGTMAIQSGLQRHCRRCIEFRCHRQQQRQAVTRASAAAAASQSTMAPATTTPMHRKSWHITQQGDMDSLQLVEEPMPTLQPGQVCRILWVCCLALLA